MINDRLSGSVVRLRGLLAEQQHDDIQTLMGRCYCCWWCFSLAAGRVAYHARSSQAVADVSTPAPAFCCAGKMA